MMKKTLLLTLVLLSGLTTTLYAQSIFQLGVKGGLLVNKSDLKYTFNTGSKINYNQSDTKLGFEVGLQFRVNLPLGFLVQPEIIYSRVNGKFDIDQPLVQGGSNSTIEVCSNWIEIPVLVGWKFSIVRLMAGPSFRFAADAKNSTPETSNRLNSVVMRNQASSDKLPFYPYDNDYYNDFIMGYQVGVGVDLGRLTIDVRYCGNFSNITDKAEISPNNIDINSMKINDQKFSLSIGFMILK